MLSKIFESLYIKVFVNIVIHNMKTTIYVEQFSRKKVLSSVIEEFDTVEITQDIKEFVSLSISESPYYYISILDNSKIQGALPSCLKSKLSYYEDMSYFESKCFKDKWSFYTSQEELYSLEKKYAPIGLDYIFSPFLVLANFFKDKINTHIAMYLLIEDEFISLSIFDNSELLYSNRLVLDEQSEENEELVYEDIVEELEDSLEDDEGINLEDLDVIDEIDSLDDFGDIEDLDSGDDFEDFEDSRDVEEDFYAQGDDEIVEEETIDTSVNDDYQRFTLIQGAVNTFYQDEKYESIFIENVYIADGVGVNSDLKRYLEEEMFLSVYVRQINLVSEVCEIAKMELNL